MQHRTICILTLTLAGCAATQTDPRTVSNIDLCRYSLRGGQNAIVADNEAARRGLDCRTYYPAIQAENARQAQALQDTANYFNRPAPPIQHAPHPTTCTSYIGGRVVTTNCW